MPEVRVPFSPPPGIHTTPDTTKQASQFWTAAQNVVWYDREPEKEAGRVAVEFTGSANTNDSIEGVPRSIFGHRIGTKEWMLIGTHLHLYAHLNGELTNIGPLLTSSDTLGNDPITTLYDDSQVTPITTTAGSNIVAVATALYEYLREGDLMTVSGLVGTAGAIGGIPVAELNTTHTIIDVPGLYVRIQVATTATSSVNPTESGSVFIAKLIRVTDTAHGLAEGDRIKLDGATTTLGVPDTEINKEHVIRQIYDANRYILQVETDASAFGSGGGASVERFKEIDAGNEDASEGRGFGMGRCGVGRCGVSKTSSAGTLTLPRIWSHAPYGQITVSCPGGNGSLYSFTGQTEVGPLAVSGAPTGDYVFETDNHLVVLNAGGTDGKVQWNNGRAGSSTDWTTTPSSGGSAGSKTLLGVGKLITHLRLASGVNVLFGTNGWQPMRWKGGVFTMDFDRAVQNNQVIIAQNARAESNGIGYFVGEKDFYSIDGVIAAPLSGNTQGQENPIKKLFYSTLNYAQKSKITCRIDEATQRFYVCYPANGATEINAGVYFSLKDGHWGIGLPPYTAFEYPGRIFDTPFGATDEGALYRLNSGVDDGDSGMEWYAESNFFALGEGSERMQIDGLILDNVQSGGDVSYTVRVKEEPNEPYAEYGPYSVDETVSFLPIGAEGRYAQIRIEGSDAGLSWRKGACKLVMQEIAVT